jgi:hypothetical protein
MHTAKPGCLQKHPGLCFARRGVALHRAGQAGAECIHRKFQREVPGRMPEPGLVRQPGRFTEDHFASASAASPFG